MAKKKFQKSSGNTVERPAPLLRAAIRNTVVVVVVTTLKISKTD